MRSGAWRAYREPVWADGSGAHPAACRRDVARRGTQRSGAGTAAQCCAREHAFISAFSDLRVRHCRGLVVPLIPADLPAALLQRRPDILQAEQNLIAANANIGATRALYFPDLSLNAAIASTSSVFGSLLTGPAAAGLVAGNLTGPIFTFGAIEGQVVSAEAAERQALAFYQQTVLNAFRETNDALTGSRKKLDEYTVQRERVHSLREFARLAKLRFDKGVTGYLDVLVAENELFAAEIASVGLQASRYAQLVNVYQAMGGGWVDLAADIAPKPLGIAAAKTP